jgi:protoheme IX farnesyltransferase
VTPRSTAKQYLELTKPRVVALIVFTAVIGMFLAVPGLPPLRQAVAGMVGIWLAAASAAALNHLIDQRIDKLMARTSQRPLATGALTPNQVLAFALILGALSMAILIALVNPLTAALTFASLIGYAVVYTAYLKRATPQNIVIGGAAGAAPPVLGWAAVTGHVHPYALLLFLIVFIWTPPHFWALAIFRRDDYARAGADAAGHARRDVHALARAVLHRTAGRDHGASISDRHERPVLSRRRTRARRRVPVLRDPPAESAG